MMRFVLFFLFASLHAHYAYFIPPSGWEIAQLKNPSPHVKIGFLSKGSTQFRPSINLATEEGVDVSLKEYVKAVKELQTAEPGTKWRDLGALPMQGGTGRLIEMGQTSPWGEVKVLQAILVHEGTAYMLTAAVSKEDFSRFQSDLLASFRSLQIIPDLSTPISDAAQRQSFHQLFAALPEQWEEFKQRVQEQSGLGPYWQFLALTEGRAKMEVK